MGQRYITNEPGHSILCQKTIICQETMIQIMFIMTSKLFISEKVSCQNGNFPIKPKNH